MRRFLVVAIVLLASSVYAQDIQSKFVGHMWEGQTNPGGYGSSTFLNNFIKFEKNGTSLVFTDDSLNTDRSYKYKVETMQLPAYLDKEKGLVVAVSSGDRSGGFLYFSVLDDGSLLSSLGVVFKPVTAVPAWDTAQ